MNRQPGIADGIPILPIQVAGSRSLAKFSKHDWLQTLWNRCFLFPNKFHTHIHRIYEVLGKQLIEFSGAVQRGLVLTTIVVKRYQPHIQPQQQTITGDYGNLSCFHLFFLLIGGAHCSCGAFTADGWRLYALEEFKMSPWMAMRGLIADLQFFSDLYILTACMLW